MSDQRSPVTSYETLRAATGVVKGKPADAVLDDAAMPESLVPLPHCRMLVGHSSDDPTPDVECGALAAYVFAKDPEHFCCERCYVAMADDPEVQAEYRPLSPASPEAEGLDPVEAAERHLERLGIPT